MERIIGNEMLKILIPVLGIGILAIILLIRVSQMVIGGSKKLASRRNLYVIVGALLIGLMGLTGHPAVFKDPNQFLIIYQVYFLALGIWHYYLTSKTFPVRDADNPTNFRLALTVAIMFMGAFLFLVLFRYFNRDNYQFWVLGSVLFFFIPFLVYETYLRAIDIPLKEIKLWSYPLSKDDDDEGPDPEILKHKVFVNFIVQKKESDTNPTPIHSEAPVKMLFSDLFYYFIKSRVNTDGYVEYLKEDGYPQQWVFYRKNKWYQFFTRYIDADKTIDENKIRHNDTIICNRS